jgi:predicted AAA+ superfamily ATPase
MVLIAGPRQVGKTFLARNVMAGFKNPQYLNYDNMADARIVETQTWASASDLLVFDEIHKMKNWKNFLKGVFDSKGAGQAIMVTGSARLDTFRQSGESLAGRYFSFHLYPFSLREVAGQMSPPEALRQLNVLGGFPEPFLSGSEVEAKRWRNQYFTDLVREDILEFSRIHELRTMRLLVEMLRLRVGSPLSIAALAGDLKVAPNTIRSYLDILESLHVIFLVRPFHANIARAIQKEPKLYFYDSGYVEGQEGAPLENTVAVCLRKHVDFLRETQGEDINLHYIRTKDKREVDFALVKDGQVTVLLEVKKSDDSPASSLKYFQEVFPVAEAFQLVETLRQPRSFGKLHVVSAAEWLTSNLAV